MATLINTDGSLWEVEPQDPLKGFQLEELYKMLECDTIEVVPTLKRGWILIIDEEGKFKENEINLKATALFPGKAYDCIVGKALLCRDSQLK
jgi:hypothetical protein